MHLFVHLSVTCDCSSSAHLKCPCCTGPESDWPWRRCEPSTSRSELGGRQAVWDRDRPRHHCRASRSPQAAWAARWRSTCRRGSGPGRTATRGCWTIRRASSSCSRRTRPVIQLRNLSDVAAVQIVSMCVTANLSWSREYWWVGIGWVVWRLVGRFSLRRPLWVPQMEKYLFPNL